MRAKAEAPAEVFGVVFGRSRGHRIGQGYQDLKGRDLQVGSLFSVVWYLNR